tara:strand:- start:419 stop:1093 length:675 start_codon:yes stop_codon:yes gene_type:complete
MGHIPQMKEALHNCDVWNDSNFIDRFNIEKININPILSIPVLNHQSKKTDLIETGGIGFGVGRIFISEKLKNLITDSNHFGIQFFKTSLYQNDKLYNGYWQTHIYDMPLDIINFKETVIELSDRDQNRRVIKKELKIFSKEEFLQILKFIHYPKMIRFKKIIFNHDLNLDFFFLSHFEPFNIVSEKLKDKLEYNKCTGMEFKPIDLSLSEWLAPGGLREKIYGH